jgi:hypothetical protein
MNTDWQTWAAAGVVAITAIIFLSRALRKKKTGGGCGTCGSGGPTVKRRQADR